MGKKGMFGVRERIQRRAEWGRTIREKVVEGDEGADWERSEVRGRGRERRTDDFM